MSYMLIKIGQPNCPPCSMVDSFLESNNVNYKSYDALEEFDIVDRFGIMSTPVTILLGSEGEEISRVVGFNPPELEKLVSQL